MSGPLGFLAWGALTDHRDFLIPNRIVAAIALLYPAFVLTSPVPVDWAYGVIAGLIVMAATTALFWLGVMGGGDAKLMAATALWTGPTLIMPFLVTTAAAGGVLSVVCLARARFAHAGTFPQSGNRRPRVPYGIAIAAGGMFVVARHLTG